MKVFGLMVFAGMAGWGLVAIFGKIGLLIALALVVTVFIKISD
jgi:hypothetical protein